MDEQPTLSERMRARADADNLTHDHELRTAAAALDDAIAGSQATPRTVGVERLIGTWAKARRIWCTYTGAPLV